MAANRFILARNRADTLLASIRWTPPLLAAAGGYGVALALWMGQAADLDGFVFRNELALDARGSLAALLLGGAAAGLIIWLALGLLLKRREARGDVWARAAVPLSFGMIAPLLPLLTLPDIQTNAPFFAIGLVAIAALLMALTLRALLSEPAAPPTDAPEPGAPVDPTQRRRERIGFTLAITLAVAYAVAMSGLSLARHAAYLTNAFDLGIHDQAIYNIFASGYMRTTLYGPYAINYIGDHFAPIQFLLAPIYLLGADARALLVLQSLFLAAAAVPLYALARLKTRSVGIALALVLAYLLHPALHGVNLADFHQIALVVVFLLAAFYFLEAKRDLPFLIALLLALMVKEEVALTTAAVGAYVFFGKRRPLMGAAIALVSLIYFGVVIGWVMPALGGTPQIDTRFGGYIAPGAQGATGVAWTLFTNPLFTLAHVFGDPAKRLFLLQVFLPVIFLPLLAPGEAWLVALPALAVLTLTSAHTQYSIASHYSAHLLPSILFLAALGAARIRRRAEGRTVAATAAVVAAILIAATGATLLWGRLIPGARSPWPQPSAHDRVVDQFVAEIPRDASVSALGGIAPHLTARKTIYLFPDVADAEYLLLDTSLEANYWPYEGLEARDKSLASMTEVIRGGAFGLVKDEDGVFLFQRGRDTGENDAALARMLSTRYEAEALWSDFDGSVAEDAGASGGKARFARPEMRREDGKQGLIYGPYTDLQPGNYRATFVIKGSGAAPDARVLTIDVFTHVDGFPRAAREIYGRDLTSEYQTFTLEFNTSGQTLADVELRAMVDFVGEVAVDRVDLEYLR